MNGRGFYSITELTNEFGITTRTLRFYEGEKLLNPQREGRKRLYSSRDRARLILILRGKRLGFSLAEIREIIEMYDLEPGESGQLQRLLGCIAKHRALLEKKRQDIDQILMEMNEVETSATLRLGELEMNTVDKKESAEASLAIPTNFNSLQGLLVRSGKDGQN
ncbi:MerR family transcriptional regulator [Kiloniella laminariae]|uniref:MerR family transcriptional regulator n=1 Tax=Kiloniella laminariae TaxID=454162 RepID=UPI00039C4192|nr:MerR family DNA-binding transcriptional regulator [Kiloniella laminariae]